MKVKEESEKVGLKLSIQKTKIMASGPITSWQIDGETVETVADFIFLGSKITAGGDCSHEIKRRLLLGRKVMTNLDSILKSRDITLPTNVHLVKARFFSVILYGWGSRTIKKTEHRRIDAFELWCWRRLLRVPYSARRSNQSILKEISPGCSLEGLLLKLKLQYFGGGKNTQVSFHSNPKERQCQILTFSSPVATVEFSRFADILSASLSQHHVLGFEIAQLEFHYLH